MAEQRDNSNNDTPKQPVLAAVASAAAPAWTEGRNVPLSTDLSGGLRSASSGGGGAVTIADGADVNEGATTNAAVVTDTNGTVSGKLRGLVKWAFERMPASLGQKTMAASLPVVVASDQSAVPVSGTVTTTPPADATTNVTKMAGTAVSMNTGVRDAGTQRVTVATNDVVPISAASLPLPTGAATETTLDVRSGSLTEAAPASDTASSGLNGRLQRVAQRLTSLIALLPVALVGGRLDVNTGSWLGSTAPTVAQKTMANSVPVVIASDQSAVPVTGPTLTKGTQGSTGFSTQDLKDAGRVTIALTIEFAFAQTAETLLTVTESRGGAATGTFTSKTITSGKRLRLTGGFAIIETLGTGTTVPQRMYLRLRVNNAGATTAASPLQFVWGLGIATGSAAIPVKASTSAPIEIPDGVEYAGDGTATYGLTLETPDWVVTTGTGRCKITLYAFEY